MSKKHRQSIRDLTLEAIEDFIQENGFERYRAGQIADWLYKRDAAGYDAMLNVPKPLRDRFEKSFRAAAIREDSRQTSSDGTVKFLFRLHDGETIESVLIPEEDRHTLCVSSQCGCAMGCLFCRTGKDGYRRNLSQGEILEQVCAARRSLESGQTLTNIVFMGMGEPLKNFDSFTGALRIMTSKAGMALSPRRITFSTAGLPDKLTAFGKLGLAMPAVSLNATTDEKRSFLMPSNRRPLAELISACRAYPLPKGELFTFEYVLIGGMNDSEDDAKRLAKLIKGMRAKVNLIPFNPFEGTEFRAPRPSAVTRFQDTLGQYNVRAFLRRSRGADIAAACGQLRSRSLKDERE